MEKSCQESEQAGRGLPSTDVDALSKPSEPSHGHGGGELWICVVISSYFRCGPAGGAGPFLKLMPRPCLRVTDMAAEMTLCTKGLC